MTKQIVILAACFFLAAARTGVSQQNQSNEIISNDMYQMAGSGDTLWMLNSKGINYTAGVIDSPIVWAGYKNINGYTISFANSCALVCMWTGKEPNELKLYNHQSTVPYTTALSYAVEAFDSLDTAQNHENSFDFYAVDAVWFGDAFWVGCLDGGLARVELSGTVSAIFYPGKDSIGYTFATFHPNNLGDSISLTEPDPIKRVRSVAGDSLALWVVCEKALWSFHPQDTTWVQISDSGFSCDEYVSCKARSSADTSFVFVTGATISTADTTYYLYVYNSAQQQWSRVLTEAFQYTPSITLGSQNYIYVINEDPAINNITLYRKSSSDATAQKINDGFQHRIRNAEKGGFGNYDINDVHYSISGRDTLFQVATSIGLFYSNNEHADERASKPFSYEGRKIVMAGNLEKTYAVPGIINSNPYYTNTHETVFAYNLSKDDYVTIDIFDYNMDFVIRIIDNAWRQAGKNRTSGRSTEPDYDRWDGTVDNRNGKVVPPGVYFYRIKTRKGKRAFGRLIVAKH